MNWNLSSRDEKFVPSGARMLRSLTNEALSLILPPDRDRGRAVHRSPSRPVAGRGP